MGCSKGYRQGVENNLIQRDIEFLSYVVTNKLVDRHEDDQSNPKMKVALDSKMA